MGEQRRKPNRDERGARLDAKGRRFDPRAGVVFGTQEDGECFQKPHRGIAHRGEFPHGAAPMNSAVTLVHVHGNGVPEPEDHGVVILRHFSTVTQCKMNDFQRGRHPGGKARYLVKRCSGRLSIPRMAVQVDFPAPVDQCL